VAPTFAREEDQPASVVSCSEQTAIAGPEVCLVTVNSENYNGERKLSERRGRETGLIAGEHCS
jgi:hypothetical protein